MNRKREGELYCVRATLYKKVVWIVFRNSLTLANHANNRPKFGIIGHFPHIYGKRK